MGPGTLCISTVPSGITRDELEHPQRRAGSRAPRPLAGHLAGEKGSSVQPLCLAHSSCCGGCNGRRRLLKWASSTYNQPIQNGFSQNLNYRRTLPDMSDHVTKIGTLNNSFSRAWRFMVRMGPRDHVEWAWVSLLIIRVCVIHVRVERRFWLVRGTKYYIRWL